jgi:hypothetical protein
MVFGPVLESSLGFEVDNTQEGSWSRCCEALSCPATVVHGGEWTARVPGT